MGATAFNVPLSLASDDAGTAIALLPQNLQANTIVVGRDGRVLRQPSRSASTGSVAEAKDVAHNLYAANGIAYVGTLNQGKPLNAPAGGAAASPLPDAVFREPGAQVYAPWQVPFAIQTGALHGVRAKNGFVAERVTVSIPCHVAKMAQVDGSDVETGYIYIGGWGANATGIAVDAGLQKSSAQSAADNYATYWKFGRNAPITFDQRFPCNDNGSVTMELRPLSSGVLAFTVSGTEPDGTQLTQTILQMTVPGDGWTAEGTSPSTGIILKRMVTIAQPPIWHQSGSTEFKSSWRENSWFGVAEGDELPRIRWTSCEVADRIVDGQPQYRRWGVEQTYVNPAMVQDFPRGAIVDRSNPALCDVVAIDLRKSAL